MLKILLRWKCFAIRWFSVRTSHGKKSNRKILSREHTALLKHALNWDSQFENAKICSKSDFFFLFPSRFYVSVRKLLTVAHQINSHWWTHFESVLIGILRWACHIIYVITQRNFSESCKITCSGSVWVTISMHTLFIKFNVDVNFHGTLNRCQQFSSWIII